MRDSAHPRDFEYLPIGTGAELARLNDLVQELGEALTTVCDGLMSCDTETWLKLGDEVKQPKIWELERKFRP